ncbi:MAG: iron-containing alcohol dehydrogenase [Deltaproteobacteria bacterium]|nr:iron-containing alcohol dehydrogenase [Deltaproteobacteria bacterium]
MTKNLIEGSDILKEIISKEKNCILVTMEEPYELIKKDVAVRNVIFNYDMTEQNLKKISEDIKDGKIIYGFGGGTACDTAKYLSARWNLPVVIAPSVVSVDAWLCRSVAVRFDHRVRYVDDVIAREFIVDYSILKKGPEILNKAGVSDVLSITTALGDWNVAKREFGDSFDISYYNASRSIADNLLSKEKDISAHNEDGLRAIVRGQLEEVLLCEEWGNSRPEEGGEHFLAYCLEEITRRHYIHGLLIALNIIVVLKLQRDQAVFDYRKMYDFFKKIGLDFSFTRLKITHDEYRKALLLTPEYIRKEKLYNGIFSVSSVFDETGEYSVDEITDWASSL